MRKVIVFALVLGLVLVSTQSFASGVQAYSGVGISYSWASSMKLEGRTDDRLEAFHGRVSNSGAEHHNMESEKGSIGGRFFTGFNNKSFGIEFGIAHLGRWEIGVGDRLGSAETHINVAYAQSFYRLTSNIDLQIGLHFNRTTVHTNERFGPNYNIKVKDTYIDHSMGQMFGIRYRFNHVWIGLEYWNGIGSYETVGSNDPVVGYVSIPFQW